MCLDSRGSLHTPAHRRQKGHTERDHIIKGIYPIVDGSWSSDFVGGPSATGLPSSALLVVAVGEGASRTRLALAVACACGRSLDERTSGAVCGPLARRSTSSIVARPVTTITLKRQMARLLLLDTRQQGVRVDD